MQAERKKIIQYALDYDINDIHTYSGYKGDLIVKITTKEKDVVLAIRRFALSLGIKEVVVKHNLALLYEIYCVTADESVYRLKTDREKESKVFLKDSWEHDKLR